MDSEKLKEILENHKHWLNEDCDGWQDMRGRPQRGRPQRGKPRLGKPQMGKPLQGKHQRGRKRAVYSVRLS